MKYVFTFNEIISGRIEIDAAHRPDRGEIIEQILEGKAHYNDTEFTDFRLVEVDGVTQAECAGQRDITAWSQYLQYLREWADSHSEPGFYGTTPACFDEWLGCEYRETESDDGSCDIVVCAGDESHENRPGTFKVTITESLQKTVTVTAADPCEAEEIVQDEWDNQEHILDADHFMGVRFEAVPMGG